MIDMLKFLFQIPTTDYSQISKLINIENMNTFAKSAPLLLIPYMSFLLFGKSLRMILQTNKSKQFIFKLRTYLISTFYFVSLIFNNLLVIWFIGVKMNLFKEKSITFTSIISVLSYLILFLLMIDLFLYQLYPRVILSRTNDNLNKKYILINYLYEKISASFTRVFSASLVTSMFIYDHPIFVIWLSYHFIPKINKLINQLPKTNSFKDFIIFIKKILISLWDKCKIRIDYIRIIFLKSTK